MQIEFIIMKEHSGFGKKLLNQKLSKHSNLENCKFLTTYFNLQKKSSNTVSILLLLLLVRTFSSYILKGVENQRCYLFDSLQSFYHFWQNACKLE